jgi:hypothetical protein
MARRVADVAGKLCDVLLPNRERVLSDSPGDDERLLWRH